MAFASLIFLFGFLPIAWGSYLLLPPRARRILLPLLSFLFYAWDGLWPCLLLLFDVTFVYFMAHAIRKYRQREGSTGRVLTALSVIIVLLPLLFFKAAPSFESVRSIGFPLGLSFYTFSLLSYLWDAANGTTAPEANYLNFLSYATFFPCLTAGPIVRYHDVRDAYAALSPRREGVTNGILRFIIGLSKKLIIGDALASAYAYFYNAESLTPTTLGAWMTAILYSLHLYYDFSGYTDMALGLGRMFGIRLPENFNYPFTATSASDFWRRWHMSLTNWFRTYVYIPLGGNRRGAFRTYRNVAVVWLLTGLWHGVGLHFLLWGAYFACILSLEKAFLGRFLSKIPTFFRRVYTLTIAVIGFLFFSTREPTVLLTLLSALVGVGTNGLLGIYESYRLLHLLPLLFIAVIGATPFPKRTMERLSTRHPRICQALLPCSMALFLLCLAYLNDAAFLPFEYAKF